MIEIIKGDCLQSLKKLEDQSINTCVTSPPYWGLRDYGESEQLGLEETPEEFVENLVEVFREVKRVLRDDGTVWLNLGDSYMGGGGGNYGGGREGGDRPSGARGWEDRSYGARDQGGDSGGGGYDDGRSRRRRGSSTSGGGDDYSGYGGAEG